MVKVTRLPLLCFLENALAFISSVPRLILVKGSGHFLLLSYPVLLYLSFTFLLLKPKTPKYLPLSVCRPFSYPVSFTSTFCSSLGSITLTYRKATIDPLALVGVARLTGKISQLNLLTSPLSTSFSGAVAGECSAIGK